MDTFQGYRASLRPIWPQLMALRRLTPERMGEADWNSVRECFCSLKVMRSGSVLVAHSKVLAHALPNLIAPIDREYTVRFLRGHKNVPAGEQQQLRWFEDIHRNFYHPLIGEGRFIEALKVWARERKPWDSSPLKVADNLVIGYVRLIRA